MVGERTCQLTITASIDRKVFNSVDARLQASLVFLVVTDACKMRLTIIWHEIDGVVLAQAFSSRSDGSVVMSD